MKSKRRALVYGGVSLLLIGLLIYGLNKYYVYQNTHFEYDIEQMDTSDREKYDEFYEEGVIAHGEFIDVKLIGLTKEYYGESLMEGSSKPFNDNLIIDRNFETLEKDFTIKDVYKEGDEVLVAEFEYIYTGNAIMDSCYIQLAFNSTGTAYGNEREILEGRVSENYNSDYEWQGILNDLHRQYNGNMNIKSMSDVKVIKVKVPIKSLKNTEDVRQYMTKGHFTFVNTIQSETFVFDFDSLSIFYAEK